MIRHHDYDISVYRHKHWEPKLKGWKAVEPYLSKEMNPFSWQILRQQVSWSVATVSRHCRDDCGNNCRKRIKSLLQLQQIGRKSLEKSKDEYSKWNHEDLAQIDRTIWSLVTKKYVTRKAVTHISDYWDINLNEVQEITQDIEDWIKNYFKTI